MAQISFCPLSEKRREMLREDPSLAKHIRDEIKAGNIPGAIAIGDIGGVRDRSKPDLIDGTYSDPSRRELLGARFEQYGPHAWERMQRIIDGQVGEKLRTFARVLSPLHVRHLAAAMRVDPPKAKTKLERVSDSARALFEQASSTNEHVLVLGFVRNGVPGRLSALPANYRR